MQLVLSSLPQRERRGIGYLSAVDLVVTNLGLFAAAFAGVYAAVYLVDRSLSLLHTILGGAMFGFGATSVSMSLLSIAFNPLLGNLPLASTAVVALFLKTRSTIDNRPLKLSRVVLTSLVVNSAASSLSSIVGVLLTGADLFESTSGSYMVLAFAAPVLQLPLLAVVADHFVRPLEPHPWRRKFLRSVIPATTVPMLLIAGGAFIVGRTAFEQTLGPAEWALGAVAFGWGCVETVLIALVAVAAFRAAARAIADARRAPIALLGVACSPANYRLQPTFVHRRSRPRQNWIEPIAGDQSPGRDDSCPRYGRQLARNP